MHFTKSTHILAVTGIIGIIATPLIYRGAAGTAEVAGRAGIHIGVVLLTVTTLYLLNIRWTLSSLDREFMQKFIARLEDALSGSHALGKASFDDVLDQIASHATHFLAEPFKRYLLHKGFSNEVSGAGITTTASARVSCRSMADQWRSTAAPAPRPAREIDDPVYGRVSLNDKLSTILAHPMVQRLSRVRQLSFSYAQFPSASHTRLAHSIGAARKAELAMEALLRHGKYYREGEGEGIPFGREIVEGQQGIIQKVKLLALLHDVGHGPFGHALDNYVAFVDASGGAHRAASQQRPDKAYTNRYISEVLGPTLRAIGYEPENLLAVLSPQRHRLAGIDSLIGSIIDSTIDADRMDYLLRDAHMTGLMMGLINAPAVLSSMRAYQRKGADALMLTFDESAVGYLEHFLLARESMHLNCYEQARKTAAERILCRLVKSLADEFDVCIDDVMALTDEQLMAVAETCGGSSGALRHLFSELISDLDYELAHQIQLVPGPSDPPLSDQVVAWQQNFILGGPESKIACVEQPALWETEIAKRSIGKQDSWQIQVVVPAYQAYPVKTSGGAKVLVKRNGAYQAESLIDRSNSLKAFLDHMNYQRRTIRVLCPSYLTSEQKESIQKAAIDVLSSNAGHVETQESSD